MMRRRLMLVGLCVCILAVFLLIVTVGYRQYLHTAYPLKYTETIQQMSEEYDISPSLICAVICTESHFRADAKSHAGAIGLMQLTPETFTWAQVRAGIHDTADASALTDPVTNIRYGTFTLKLLHEMFTEPDTALAAYNAGLGNVNRWLKDTAYSDDGVHLHTIPFDETAGYIKKVRKAQTIYQKLYNLE